MGGGKICVSGLREGGGLEWSDIGSDSFRRLTLSGDDIMVGGSLDWKKIFSSSWYRVLPRSPNSWLHFKFKIDRDLDY